MADISKISPDEGITIYDLKDNDAVHYADNAVLGAKNLLKWSKASTTINGVTFTNNGDGTISAQTDANGATADAHFIIVDSATAYDHTILGKKIILSGAPAQSGSDYPMMLVPWGGSNSYDYGNGVEIDIPSSISGLRVDCIVWKNRVLTTPITFKPMIRLASDTDTTYVRYAMTNRELTENVMLEDIYENFFSNVPTGLTVKGKGSTFISKVGKMVVGTVVIDNPNGFTSGTSYTLTIDDKYKPHENFNATGQFVDNEWDGITTSATGYMFLGNGGSFIIKQTSGQSLRYFKGQFAYTTL